MILTIAWGSAFACMCAGSDDVEDFYQKFDHIFVVRIVGSDLKDDPTTRGGEVIVARFETIEVFRGSPNDVVITSDSLATNFDSCSKPMVVGGYYLVFAVEGQTTHLEMCAASHRVTYYEDDVSPSVTKMRQLLPARTSQ